MKQLNKKFIIGLFVLGIALFCTSPVFANGLDVEFEDEPLFDETNFLPGESITRWVKVTNNSGENQSIAAEAINVNNFDGLGYALVLEITEGSQSHYINDLSKFFDAGEVYLSDLANGSSTTYNFSISFYPESSNTFQGKSLGFDILIGFQGEGGGLPPGSGGGGGGFLPRGLTIIEPIYAISGEETATITWETSYEATSRVVYGTTSGQFDLSAGEPSYGYEFYSDKNLVKTKNHSITLMGLTPGTTYYYRCVSHASLAISTEHSFTTLVVEEAGEEIEEGEMPNETIGEEEPSYAPEGAMEGKEEPAYTPGGVSAGKEEEPAQISEEIEADKEEPAGEEEEAGVRSGLGALLAAIGDLFKLKNLWWLLLLLLLILIILYLLSRKKKKNKA